MFLTLSRNANLSKITLWISDKAQKIAKFSLLCFHQLCLEASAQVTWYIKLTVIGSSTLLVRYCQCPTHSHTFLIDFPSVVSFWVWLGLQVPTLQFPLGSTNRAGRRFSLCVCMPVLSVWKLLIWVSPLHFSRIAVSSVLRLWFLAHLFFSSTFFLSENHVNFILPVDS